MKMLNKTMMLVRSVSVDAGRHRLNIGGATGRAGVPLIPACATDLLRSVRNCQYKSSGTGIAVQMRRQCVKDVVAKQPQRRVRIAGGRNELLIARTMFFQLVLSIRVFNA